MIKKNRRFFLMFLFLALAGWGSIMKADAQRSELYWADKPFIQEYSIKFYYENANNMLREVASDRNGNIQIFSSEGLLLKPRAGKHLFPGTLVKDVYYLPTSDKGIKDLEIVEEQFVYVDDKAVFSNAWAGKLYSRHRLPEACIFAAGEDFTFLISDGSELNLLKDSETLWGLNMAEEIEDIKYDSSNNLFWILSNGVVHRFSPESKKLETAIENTNITCIEPAGDRLIAGTTDGYFELNASSGELMGDVHRDLPWTEITTVSEIDGDIWFGSTRGAFRRNDDGSFNYYASKRWLPSDYVTGISKGPENSILILTGEGLAQICRKEMTLFDKAVFFDEQVRKRHIRNGFNADIAGMADGDVTTGSLRTSDNDGLWTSMYLAGEVFRYKVTNSDEALKNVRESLEAMERLYTINPIPGFPSRSFERRGYKYHDKKWRRAEDPEWDWKSTTSSDEAIGHIFAFGAIAELIEVPDLKKKAIMLIDTLMSHVVRNDFYMIDWNGEPTTWGRWHPEYVNARPKMVGDRKINSSNIIGMLQTAYHFTQKEKYKDAAFYLMDEHGYLENLMRPMSEIGQAPESADDWSRMLSGKWNHSDDEMYYCGYWGLYRYAFNDTLKAMYKKAIIDHWEAERPEKEGLWNIMTAIAGDDNYDFDEAIWFLQEYPMDLIHWNVNNSHRKDIKFVPENFRSQTIEEVLPPDELGIRRHNANRFELDRGGAGQTESSAGDIWLLPYWIGRYLNVIGEPGAELK